ncbi:hypothetical protein BDZ91DRAFT_752476 [Kalaharituber pfeilii]|nr:hypothetical protein BDZ91DRAFT_752476 [Kalaharituber pfeilii]
MKPIHSEVAFFLVMSLRVLFLFGYFSVFSIVMSIAIGCISFFLWWIANACMLFHLTIVLFLLPYTADYPYCFVMAITKRSIYISEVYTLFFFFCFLICFMSATCLIICVLRLPALLLLRWT